jgi:hypothetical protein
MSRNTSLVEPAYRRREMKFGNLPYAIITLLLTVPLLVASCTPESPSHSIVIPVGRSAVVEGHTFEILIDADPYKPQVSSDNYGGYWAEIPYDPQKNSEVLLTITIENKQSDFYRDESAEREIWLSPSKLINSDHPALISQAKALAMDSDTVIEKARGIQDFVIRHLEFRIYRNHFIESASDTYKLGFGTCVNYARLFVALCRAANVPARTVWGIINIDGVYDYHHEWAEFLDDDGYWHPLDLTFTTSFNLSDIRYLDLIYASEENPLYEQSRSDQYSEEMTQVIVYDTTHQPYDGRLGFRLIEDNSPAHYIVENQFILADIPRLVPQKVP